ncbi:MAG: D-tyrosyl-tRNA(Tyr) deacylase [Prevotella sp.]|nr:D-tyrosyl-tRNA(Tyr) deacylase [Prevotella sp.]
MRVVVQRVSRASVTIGGELRSAIARGLLLLVGIGEEDTREDIDYLVKKVVNLRIFNDLQGVMNLSVLDVGGEILAVSQFTLMASTKKGNRPSYIRAARHEVSIPLYNEFVGAMTEALGKPIGTGEFGADMKVELLNDGPVTIIIDSKEKDF